MCTPTTACACLGTNTSASIGGRNLGSLNCPSILDPGIPNRDPRWRLTAFILPASPSRPARHPGVLRRGAGPDRRESAGASGSRHPRGRRGWGENGTVCRVCQDYLSHKRQTVSRESAQAGAPRCGCSAPDEVQELFVTRRMTPRCGLPGSPPTILAISTFFIWPPSISARSLAQWSRPI